MRKFLLLIALLLPLSVICSAQTSLKKGDGWVSVTAPNNKTLKVHLVTEDIARIEISATGEFKESSMIQFGFVKDDFATPDYKVKEDKESYKISTDELNISINKSTLAVAVTNNKGELLLKESSSTPSIVNADSNTLSFDMGQDEHFFGFGFMRETLDAKGKKLTFKREYRWNEATLPYFMSTNGFAFYSNSVYNQTFDFTGEDNYTISSNSPQIDYYIINGPSFAQIIDRYTDLTGKSMMIPRWGFGSQFRMRYYADDKETLLTANKFREKEIPCDIMALEPGWEGTSYSMIWEWSQERFPDPEWMIDSLNRMGFKFDLWESGKAPTTNITNEQTRREWFEPRKKIIDMGVDMFKQDDPYPRSIISIELEDAVLSGDKLVDNLMSAEELNNVANTFYSQTVFDEYRKHTNKRAIVMFHAYNASVATHRWPFQWAGDFNAGNGMINASLSGHAMVSYDIRNPFAAGWHQGFFTPFTVVDSWAYYREPWLYLESIEQTHRMYACLRSRLVPYLYNTLWQSHQSGIPMIRPMVLLDKDDKNVYSMKSQYMVGDWFLIALSDVDDSPAGQAMDYWTGTLLPNIDTMYMPKGRWIDYWSGKVHDMKEAKQVTERWPEGCGGLLYVKAGAIIPMGQVKDFIGQSDDNIITLDIYPYKESSYELFEDDGESFDYEEGKYTTTDIHCKDNGKKAVITIGEREGGFDSMIRERSYMLKVHCLSQPKEIVVDKKAIKYFADKNELLYADQNSGWYYDRSSHKAIIKLDKGWKFIRQEDSCDPMGTLPPTARHEKVEIVDESALQSQAERVIVIKYGKAPTASELAEMFANYEESTAPGVVTKEGVMQARFNPPEQVKMKGNADWMPTAVTVFVNFMKDGKVMDNCANTVTLNVYSKEGELLDTYQDKAKDGELVFKDIPYYKRPAQCLFELKCDGYETIQQRIFENTWDL